MLFPGRFLLAVFFALSSEIVPCLATIIATIILFFQDRLKFFHLPLTKEREL